MFNIQPFEELASHNCGRIDSKGFCFLCKACNMPFNIFLQENFKNPFFSVFIQHEPHMNSQFVSNTIPEAEKLISTSALPTRKFFT